MCNKGTLMASTLTVNRVFFYHDDSGRLIKLQKMRFFIHHFATVEAGILKYWIKIFSRRSINIISSTKFSGQMNITQC